MIYRSFSKAGRQRRTSSPITCKSLPSPITRFVREVVRMPLFTWTVRSDEDRLIAAQWADAPIFEGFEA